SILLVLTLTLSYPLSLNDALPILDRRPQARGALLEHGLGIRGGGATGEEHPQAHEADDLRRSVHVATVLLLVEGHLVEVAPHRRSEEHTSELQSREKIVCRLLLEK